MGRHSGENSGEQTGGYAAWGTEAYAYGYETAPPGGAAHGYADPQPAGQDVFAAPPGAGEAGQGTWGHPYETSFDAPYDQPYGTGAADSGAYATAGWAAQPAAAPSWDDPGGAGWEPAVAAAPAYAHQYAAGPGPGHDQAAAGYGQAYDTGAYPAPHAYEALADPAAGGYEHTAHTGGLGNLGDTAHGGPAGYAGYPGYAAYEPAYDPGPEPVTGPARHDVTAGATGGWAVPDTSGGVTWEAAEQVPGRDGWAAPAAEPVVFQVAAGVAAADPGPPAAVTADRGTAASASRAGAGPAGGSGTGAWAVAPEITAPEDPPAEARTSRAGATSSHAPAPGAPASTGRAAGSTRAASTRTRAASSTSTATATATGAGGRAAARRAARAEDRRPRRGLVATGGVVVTGAVLAGAFAMQMPQDHGTAQAAGEGAAQDDPRGDGVAPASRSNERGDVQTGGQPAARPGTPGPASLPVPTADQGPVTERLKLKFPLAPDLALGGKFDVVPGRADGAGKGKVFTYRVEVERGLDLDGALFADFVQATLNDQRSWAHDGARSFTRTDAQAADFVVRLASPGTTDRLCRMSGLDVTETNVSCDSAATQYVVINAWRWAQGSVTYGEDMHAYRQMLINHEVGHRLGNGHNTLCGPDGLAPVMMQQTKSLEATNGQSCAPNPWPYPA